MSISLTDYEKRICDILNQYCFDWVWNEPVSEFRQNIKPRRLSQFSQSGNFNYNGQLIKLPTAVTGPFYLYALERAEIASGLGIPTNTWIDTQTLCNSYNVLWSMYTYQGMMFHKNRVFLLLDSQKTRLFIAVQKVMASKFMTIDVSDQVYFTPYTDSDIIDKCTVECYYIPTTDYSLTYRASILSRLNILTASGIDFQVYINGLECTNPLLNLNIGDYVDIVVDENVKLQFDIDLTDNSQDIAYFSSRDKVNKQVIHIPKKLNPDNKIITHNTCDFWVRRKEPLNQPVEGVYLYRAADISVDQITHNDFSIPRYVIEAFKDHLGTQNVTIHCVCRIHDKDNVLTRDPSYIDLLYSQSDTDIQQILKGELIPSNLNFWTADQLEQSAYVSMFFDLAELYSQNIDYYVRALGYYHTLQLIAGRIVTSTIDSNFVGNFEYTKSPLYQDVQAFPIVYRNGLKVSSNLVNYANLSNGNLTIELKDAVNWSTGDKFDTVLYVDGDRRIYQVKPTAELTSFTLPYNQFKIYQKIDNTHWSILGVDHQSTVAYRDVTDVLGLYAVDDQSDGSTIIHFSQNMQDQTYYLLNETCTYNWQVDITTIVDSGDNISLLIQAPTEGDVTDMVPILNQKNIGVYLNGHYLIRDLDYKLNIGLSTDGDISFIQVCIQSMEYLQDGQTNLVELIINAMEIEDYSFGFQLNNLCTDDTPANLWFPDISLCHVDGQLETTIADHGLTLELPTDKYRQGAPFEIQTSVPSFVRQFMDKYQSDTDKQRLTDINTYLGQHLPPSPTTVLLPQEHRIYSTLLNRVLRDVLFADKQFASDADINKVKEQLVDYAYLKPLDIVQINALDHKFIDYYPAYRQYEIIDEDVTVLKSIITVNLPTGDTVRDVAETYK